MEVDFLYIAVHTLIVVVCGVVSWIGGYNAGKRLVEEHIALREKLAFKKGERAGIAWAREELTRIWKK